MIKGHTLICACNTKVETETYERPRFVDSRRRTSSCYNCKNSSFIVHYEYVNVVRVKLQDDEPDLQLEQLTCLLYGADTMNIYAGETAVVKGRVEVESRKNLLYPVLHTQSIKYERRQEHDITSENIDSFKRFAKIPNVIDRLVSMFAPNVIGHNAEKLGILRSVSGAPEGNIRGRIHTLLIGPPGVAKSMLGREAVKAGESSPLSHLLKFRIFSLIVCIRLRSHSKRF